MPHFSQLSADDQKRYFALVEEALAVRRHFDLLLWLQGDVQHFLPHEIMLAAWGDLRLGLIAHDIVSALPGVRTQRASVASVSPLLSGLYKRWTLLEPALVTLTPERTREIFRTAWLPGSPRLFMSGNLLFSGWWRNHALIGDFS